MTWNYRVCKETVPNPLPLGEADTTLTVYSIREVYYEGEEIKAWSTEPTRMDGYESAEDAVEDAALMAQAHERPVLDLDEQQQKREGKTT